ncbi:MAG: restriction endonuclease subunit S [Paludibacteraceae bacterium]|nr:restriction endonuclease subunit S [Paludibacteraceae bacterium]
MEWKTVKLGDILNFRRGHDLPHSEMREGDIPVAGSNGCIGYHNVATPITPIITIGRSGNIGTPYYYEKAWAHNTTLYLDDFKGNNPKYLYYLLKTLPLAAFTGGSAVPTLNRNHIHPLEVLHVDDRATQDKIVAILSSLDDKIENNNRINRNLEEQAQALFKSWFGEETNTIKLSDISLNVTDGVHNTVVDDKEGEYMLLSCKNIVGGHLSITPNERHINRETFEKLRKRTKLAQGDILISTVGTVGEVVMLYDNPTNIEFQRSVGLVKPDKTKTSSTYMYCALRFKQNALKHIAHGAVQQCIFIGDLKNFEIPYSTIEKTLQFDNIVSPIFDHIFVNIKENQRLATIRDTLLPKLMKGEIEV